MNVVMLQNNSTGHSNNNNNNNNILYGNTLKKISFKSYNHPGRFQDSKNQKRNYVTLLLHFLSPYLFYSRL